MVRKNTQDHSEERQTLDLLLKSCLSIDSDQNEKKLFSLRADFSKFSQDLHKQVAAFKDIIARAPLSSFVILWGELISKDKIFGKRYLCMMRELVEAKLLALTSEKKKTVFIRDVALQDPALVIERIRCHKDWPISKREDFVLLYKTFSEWLSQETFGYVSQAKDLDRLASEKRRIPFESYIDMLSHMDLREQILTKMFYLGGQRPLEEVLSVRVEDIDFSHSRIHFSEDVFYPRHLFEDIKRFIQSRKKGYVFIGKEGERISTTTPFRSLKKVVSELGLDPEFTFKEFTKNV